MNEMAETKDIESKIYNIRGVKVMLDSDLAKQYQCANGTKSINLAVKRNIERFPSDFYFQLNEEEFNKICGFNLKLQNSKIRSLPYVFTEQGVAMLATVIKTDVAATVSIDIMRAFIKMRHYIKYNDQILPRKYLLLEEKVDNNTKRINEAVKNNPDKFPRRFSWILSDEEKNNLWSKFSTANISSMSRSNPRVFTEQAVYMLATILKSKTATEVSIRIMDTLKHLKDESYNGKYKHLYMGFGNGLSIDNSIYEEFEPYLNEKVQEYLKGKEDQDSLKYAAIFNTWQKAFMNMVKDKGYILKK